MATIEELLGRSNEQLANMSDAEILSFLDQLKILEPKSNAPPTEPKGKGETKKQAGGPRKKKEKIEDLNFDELLKACEEVSGKT